MIFFLYGMQIWLFTENYFSSNCLIHKTVANVIIQNCQKSKKLWDLQKNSKNFYSNLHSIQKKHNFEEIFYGIFLKNLLYEDVLCQVLY